MSDSNIIPDKIKFALLLAYEGTHFYGWQRQRHERTVQGIFEEALEKLYGSHITVYGASRTDAGVHAFSQVAHISVPQKLGPDELKRYLNAVIGKDACVRSIVHAPETFHARHSSCEKVYRYRIWTEKQRNPFLRKFSHHCRFSLDKAAMIEACRLLEGEHDFAAFRSSSCTAKSTIRTLSEVSVKFQGPLFTFTFRGNGFLQHMIRILMGTIIDCGRHKIDINHLEALLASGTRTDAGETFPSRGLILEEVHVHDVQFDCPVDYSFFNGLS